MSQIRAADAVSSEAPAQSQRPRITEWVGCSADDQRLDFVADGSSARLPFDRSFTRYRATASCAAGTSLLLRVYSPRPIRISTGGVTLADEHHGWRTFQRLLELAIVMPVSRNRMQLNIEIGQRPRHPQSLDESCPSRNRDKLMRRLAEELPDELRVELEQRAEAGASVMLRFTPSQIHRDGVIWQRVYARNLAFDDGGPTTYAYQYEDRPRAALSVRSSIGACDGLEATSQTESAHGVRRFYVPVASSGSPAAPLRSTGIEPRSEPRCEVTGQIPIQIETAGGTTRLEMPVFESLGRHAPRREFRPTQWPSLEKVLAAAPEPILPPAWQHFHSIYNEAWAMLLRLARPGDPLGGLPCGFVNTGTNFPNFVFLWDTSFTAMAAAYAWRAFPVTDSLDLQYSRQFDGGYIHREHDTRDGMPIIYELDFSPNPPISVIAEWRLARLTGDVHRLRRVWPVLTGYHRWLRNNRKLPDGTYWTTGLANGLDNSPSMGDGYPDLTAQMAHAAETLAAIARVLGDDAAEREFADEHRSLAEAINARLWSDALKFYATSLPDGAHNPNKVVTGFWPLWAGVVPAERVEHLARHAMDPSSFYRHHPLPSLAADSPSYKSHGDYWLGSTWAPTNYAAIKGFARSERMDVARDLSERHLQCMHEVFVKTGSLWENYGADASVPGSLSAPDYCWSALGPIALLFETLIGVEPNALEMSIDWTLPTDSAGVRRYPLGPATVDLRFDRDEGKIWATTDRAIELRLKSAHVVNSTVRRHHLPPGEHQLAADGL